MADLRHAQYFRPSELGPALDWLADNDACVAAGCTDLLPSTSAPQLAGHVLDLTAIPNLRGISRDGEDWRFGATTTWTDIIRAELPPAFDALKLAAREVGSQQIQHAGTIAGNLCNASPAADGTPCWLTLDAQVELASKDGTRVLPLDAFVTGPRKTALKSGEIVSAIRVPHASAGGRSSFLKLGARKYLVISIAMVAVRVEERDGVVSDIAVSVGSCSAVATRLTELEAALTGQHLSDINLPRMNELIDDAIDPIDDLRSNASGRRAAASELVHRCIASLSQTGADAA